MSTRLGLAAALALALSLGTAADFPQATAAPVILPTIQVIFPNIFLGATIDLRPSFISLTGTTNPNIVDLAFGTARTGPYWIAGIFIAIPQPPTVSFTPYIGIGLGLNPALSAQIRITYDQTLIPALTIFLTLP